MGIESYIGIAIAVFLVLLIFVIIPAAYRKVVSTNEVHIVQSSKATTSYGKDTENGNSYYEWPSWIPVFGITKVVLPVSVFDLDLVAYEAYDKGRLPFVVDVKAFFRISESDMAAQRVASFDDLHSQLKAIVQGAVRTILASSDIEDIMQGRSTFGEAFTKEVSCQLKAWGVETVKNIELMDIRDGKDSKVIHNIMEKKKSHIEMQSRTEVAQNHKAAEIAEIEAKREVDLQSQEAAQQVGLRTVEAKQRVEIAQQGAYQNIKEQEKITKEKEMQVIKVSEVNKAEIAKSVAVVGAEQAKETSIIGAEQQKTTSIIKAEGELESKKRIAEGNLEMQKREAEGTKLVGLAKADAEKAMLMAPVDAQISLAKEIGSNEKYQQYLVTIEQIKANQSIGVEQAGALQKSEIKIIVNASSPSDGISKVSELFTSGGGMKIGTMLEGLSNTDIGKTLLDKLNTKS